jgi:hypothetical protein
VPLAKARSANDAGGYARPARSRAAHGGGDDPLDLVFPRVYEKLKRPARTQLAQEWAEHTLQPTALAREAWLRSVPFAGTVVALGRAPFV